MWAGPVGDTAVHTEHGSTELDTKPSPGPWLMVTTCPCRRTARVRVYLQASALPVPGPAPGGGVRPGGRPGSCTAAGLWRSYHEAARRAGSCGLHAGAGLRRRHGRTPGVYSTPPF